MKTLDELIDYAEHSEDSFGMMRDDEHQELWGSIARYLKEYRDSRHLLQTDRIIAYWGPLPIIKLYDKFFAVREYVPKHKAWRCNRMAWNAEQDVWSCIDDENYIISNDGALVCKEYGYDLREVYPEDGAKI